MSSKSPIKIKEDHKKTLDTTRPRKNFIKKGERILKFIERNDGVTSMQIARAFKIPETTMRSDLQRLLNNKMVYREKCKCGQGWLFSISVKSKKKK